MDYSINCGKKNTGQPFGKSMHGSKSHFLYKNKIQKYHQKFILKINHKIAEREKNKIK